MLTAPGPGAARMGGLCANRHDDETDGKPETVEMPYPSFCSSPCRAPPIRVWRRRESSLDRNGANLGGSACLLLE